MIALSDSEVTKRMAAYAALIAVPSFIAGVYGMNFSVMPELHWVFGYPFAVLLMVVADIYIFRRLRKARWI
jgi:magnesium transporter